MSVAPVDERCVLELEYSWHVPLIAPLHVLAVEAESGISRLFTGL